MSCSKRVPAVAQVLPGCGYAWALILMVAAISVTPLHADNAPPSSTTLTETDGSAPSATGQSVPSPGCALDGSASREINRVGQRDMGRGINLYSLTRERSLGEAMAAAIDKQTKAVTDPKIKDYIVHLGQKIVRNSDARIAFTIKVIDSANPTTFSLPGGFLYVDEGLLLDVESEAELVGLMAHEIAHVVARHATRFVTRKNALDALSIPASRLIGPAGLPARQIGLMPLERKVNRRYEFEADLLGMEYQYASGYDPEAYIRVLEKLDSDGIQKREREARDNPDPDFVDRMYIRIGRSFSPYPPTEQRIARLQKEISKLLPCRDDYVVDTSEFQEVKSLLGAQRLVLRRPHAGHSANGPVLERRPLPHE